MTTIYGLANGDATRISSRFTWAFKWLPPLFLGGTGVFTTAAFLMETTPNLILALVMVLVFFGGAFFHCAMYGPISDRVDDRVDHLLVHRGGREDRIMLRDVVAVTMRNLGFARVTLHVLDVRFHRPAGSDGEFTFIPTQGWSWTVDSIRRLRDDILARTLGHQRPAQP